MSSKTRIIVLHMKEIIYTAVFLALAVVLAVVLASVLAVVSCVFISCAVVHIIAVS